MFIRAWSRVREWGGVRGRGVGREGDEEGERGRERPRVRVKQVARVRERSPRQLGHQEGVELERVELGFAPSAAAGVSGEP